MAGHEYSQVRPQTEQDRSVIAAGSPLAIQGVFLEVIRERFSEEANVDWTWRNELTKTEIVIETSFNEETETRSETPAIYITRLQSRPDKMQVGDRAGVKLPEHLEGFSAMMNVALGVECVSNDAGESSIIADIVQFHLLASEDPIQKHFGFHNMTHPIMGQTVPFPQAPETKWTTSLNFEVSFWVRWTQVPIAPILQQITNKVTTSSDSNYFIQNVINSMRRSQ